MGKIKAPKAGRDKEFSLPDNAAVDFSCFDWGDEKITDRQKLFVFWFSLPFQEAYHCGVKAARKAGYTAKSALVNAYKIRRDPKISKLIKQFEETIGKVNIVDTAQRWLQEKITRGDYDVKDYYETVEYKTATGKTQRELRLKDIDALTPEQRLCIDGIDVKGMQGTMVYSLPDREKIRDSLINFMQKAQGGDNDEYDVEAVAEIIKANIQVKSKVINRNREIMSRAVGFVDAPRKIIEEE